MSAGIRTEGTSGSASADITVASDGTGDVRTVGEALASAESRPGDASRPLTIFIKPGIYREKLIVPAGPRPIQPVRQRLAG